MRPQAYLRTSGMGRFLAAVLTAAIVAPGFLYAANSKGLSPEAVKRGQAAQRERAADQAAMVRKAPAGFEPKQTEGRLAFGATPEKARLRPGDALRLRLTLTNVGGTALRFLRKDSLMKRRGAYDSCWRFSVRSPEKDWAPMVGPLPEPGKGHGTAVLTTSESAEEAMAADEAFSWLDVVIGPGETLVSLPRTSREPLKGGAPSLERELVTVSSRYSFRDPGRYEVRVEHLCPSGSGTPEASAPPVSVVLEVSR